MVGTRLISSKIRWILPKSIKESVDLPDFVKESVFKIQILCTFQARMLLRRACCYGAPGEKPRALAPAAGTAPAHPRARIPCARIPHVSAGA